MGTGETPTGRHRDGAPRQGGRGRRLGAIGLLAGLIGSLGALIGAPGAAHAATDVSSGDADWGVKASFRTYVTGPVGGGSITTTDGATVDPDGTFRFPNATGTADHGAGSLDVAFDGGVQFLAHAGALDLTISDVRITRTGTSGALTADVVSRSLDTGLYEDFPDIAFASLDYAGVAPSTAGDATTYSGVPATLTAAGAAAFAGFYPAGTALDPVTFTTSAAPPASTSTTSSTTTSTTASTATTAPAPPATPPYGTATATGPTGQRVTVTPAYDLHPAGTTVTVTGEGYDRSLGIYLAFCVDRGPDVPPSPCLGGADTSGESDSAVWISDDPPPYGEDLAQPFGPGGSFAFEITVRAEATDTAGAVIADCLDGTTQCVVATRADHTAAADRSADVKVPVAFVGQTPPPPAPEAPTVEVDATSVPAGGTVVVRGAGFVPGEQVAATLLPSGVWLTAGTADADGAVTLTAVIPVDTAPGQHTVELRGLSSGLTGTSAPFTVTAATAPPLPATGWSPGLAVTGAALLASGAALVLATRSDARPGRLSDPT
jgi:hypothetical protein